MHGRNCLQLQPEANNEDGSCLQLDECGVWVVKASLKALATATATCLTLVAYVRSRSAQLHG